MAARALAGRGPAGRAKTSENTALMRDLSQAAVSKMNSKVPNSGTADRAMLNYLLGAGLTGGAATGVPLTAPLAGAAATAGLINTDIGRKLMAQILARRPELAKGVSRRFQQTVPTIGGATQREEM